MPLLHRSLLTITFLYVHLFSFAQKPVFDPLKLKVEVSVPDNHYLQKNQALALFSFVNNNKVGLPAKGWKLFFNMKNQISIADNSTGLKLSLHQGNLYSLEPGEDFREVQPLDSLVVKVVVDGSFENRNDHPEGFYIVWDATGKGFNLAPPKYSRPLRWATNAKHTSDFAQEIFERNERIDSIKIIACPIFPTPEKYNLIQADFPLAKLAGIFSAEIFRKEASALQGDLLKISGVSTRLLDAPASLAITLSEDRSLPAEAYKLDIDDRSIKIVASDAAGIFHGIQSLKTLLPIVSKSKQGRSVQMIQGISVTDKPRYPYRGFMMDVARNFQTKEEVLRVLDLMAIYKLNNFHFHLTDDEGWRLQINGLPELTAVGSNRGHPNDEKTNLPAAYGSGGDTAALYGSGHYSKKDFIEILQYARDRHINVIPEIETPGHARAAIKAMDARYARYMAAGDKSEALKYFLRDTADESQYTTPQWFHDNVMNVALPSVYTFLTKVVDEIRQMYQEAGVPMETVHLGGDEVPAGVWEKSPLTKQLIASSPEIQNTNGLWYYYISKMNSILRDRKLRMAGWEEVGLRKTKLDGRNITIPNPQFIGDSLQLYVWNNTEGNEDLAYKLANAGYPVVLTFVSNFYLDMMQYRSYDEPGYHWGGITDIEKTFRFIPNDYLKNERRMMPIDSKQQRLTDYGQTNIKGIQGALWSETLKGAAQLEYMLLPRLSALAEKCWSPVQEWETPADSLAYWKDYTPTWSAFIRNVGLRQLPFLDHLNGGYLYRVPPAGAVIRNGQVFANSQIPGMVIRYSTDGSEPDARSRIYKAAISDRKIITFKVFNGSGRTSYSTTIDNR